MPRLFPFALGLAFLSGCPDASSGKDEPDSGDTAGGGDTDGDTDRTGDITIESLNGTCSGSICTWEVETRGEMGAVSLALIETGDPSFECFVECGVWREDHDDFARVDFVGERDTKTISLALVDDPSYQVENLSTLFDVNDPAIANQLTVLFVVQDAEGRYGDCATYGHDPGYFADTCTNNADAW